MHYLTLPGWNLDLTEAPRIIETGLTGFITKFDQGAYALVILASGKMEETLREGLQSAEMLTGRLEAPVHQLEAELAARPDYRRGLTALVHGGAGRGFAAGFLEAPEGWHRLAMSLGDALRLAWDHDFSASRAWKISEQQAQLHKNGYRIQNINGFLNLYGYLQSQRFSPIPKDLGAPGMLGLGTDFVLQVRARIRQSLDYHVALGPDTRSWVEVQRSFTDVFFKEVQNLPLFVAPQQILAGRLLACVETDKRPWWVECAVQPRSALGRAVVHQIWDAAQNWLVRLAPRLEAELGELPTEPVWIRLDFPEIEDWQQDSAVSALAPIRPSIRLGTNAVYLDLPNAVLRGFALPTNIGERWLIASMAMAAAGLSGADRKQDWADALAAEITRTEDARFGHMIPASGPAEMLRAAMPLPAARLVPYEDREWSYLGLAKVAGYAGAGEVPTGEVGGLLQQAVLRLWERIRSRLSGLDRRSVVVAALLNHEALDKDRSEWAQTAAALLALHRDEADIIRVHNERESRRALAGIASRVIAEMAICTAPTGGAQHCTDIDLDEMIADVATMLDCAGQCDAYHYNLATSPLRVTANGSFDFSLGFLESLHLPYLYAHGERSFRNSAEDYGEAFRTSEGSPETTAVPTLDAEFTAAFEAEFGMTAEDLVAFTFDVTERALQAGVAYLSVSRSELLTLFAAGDRATRVNLERALHAMTLQPRDRWDEMRPKGALARDWQPWRMDRKLAVTRRPLIMLENGPDPEILIFPALLDRITRRLLQLVDGRLPAEMFDTAEVKRWIGRVVDERGHAFNIRVAKAFQELGFAAVADVEMTRLGGNKALGDVDVLAWSCKTGEIWAVECKRLHMDRTVGEIGERLADYSNHPASPTSF